MGRRGQHFVVSAVVAASAVQGGCGESRRSAAGADSGGSLSTGGSKSSGGSGGGRSGAAGGAGAEPNALGTGELGACNDEGWCWQGPARAGETFYGLSDDGRYAAGENGIVFEWPDTYLPRAGTSPLSLVQATGDTVWAGGSFGLWRYDGGGEWLSESEAQVSALSVAPSGDVWTITWAIANQEVHHWHDGVWTTEAPPVPTTEPRRILADVVAVDDETTWVLVETDIDPKVPFSSELLVLELRAGVWSTLRSGIEDSTGGWSFVREGTNVYVYSLKQGGIYSPADGWTLVATPPRSASYGVFAAPGGGLLAGGTDGVYSVGDPGGDLVSHEPCAALVPLSDDDALCARNLGGLVKIRPSAGPTEPLDHLALELFGQVPTPIWAQAYVAWGSGPTDVWRPPLDHFDGASWKSVPGPDDQDFWAQLIDGSAPDNVWFWDQRQLVRYDGEAMVVIPLPVLAEEGPGFLSALHTLGPEETWIVYGLPGTMHIWRYDGAGWSDTLAEDGFSSAYIHAAIAGGGSEPLYAAFGSGLYRRVGDAWDPVVSDGTSFSDVAVDGNAVWAQGGGGVQELVDGALVLRGTGGLVHLGLTERYVWTYYGTNARTLSR